MSWTSLVNALASGLLHAMALPFVIAAGPIELGPPMDQKPLAMLDAECSVGGLPAAPGVNEQIISRANSAYLVNCKVVGAGRERRAQVGAFDPRVEWALVPSQPLAFRPVRGFISIE